MGEIVLFTGGKQQSGRGRRTVHTRLTCMGGAGGFARL